MRWIAFAIVLATAAICTVAAQADEPPAVARRLWHDLVCLCPDCDRLRLEDCQCDIANRERQAIVAQVREHAGERDADVYRTIVESYVARSGERVLAEQPTRDWRALLFILVVPVGGILAIVLLDTRRRKARPRVVRRR